MPYRAGKLRTPPSADARALTQTPTNAVTESRPFESRERSTLVDRAKEDAAPPTLLAVLKR
jgi:hypothetical protein